MGFPGASCLFWSISYNLPQSCNEGYLWQSEKVLLLSLHGEPTKVVMGHHFGNPSTILSMAKADSLA